MNCLWCEEEILVEISWINLVVPPQEKLLCKVCEKGLEKITGEHCNKCCRKGITGVCEDCKWWDKQMAGEDCLKFNHSLFTYNEQMQEMIAKWKYRGDYELGKAFQHAYKEGFLKKFKRLKDVVVIPVPLSGERLQDRRFNQAKMLADFLPLPVHDVLSRVDSEKQSKKSRWERIETKNPFKLDKTINNRVILVDDIYTTGTTLRHAANKLEEHGVKEIYSYTLIRG